MLCAPAGVAGIAATAANVPNVRSAASVRDVRDVLAAPLLAARARDRACIDQYLLSRSDVTVEFAGDGTAA